MHIFFSLLWYHHALNAHNLTQEGRMEHISHLLKTIWPFYTAHPSFSLLPTDPAYLPSLLAPVLSVGPDNSERIMALAPFEELCLLLFGQKLNTPQEVMQAQAGTLEYVLWDQGLWEQTLEHLTQLQEADILPEEQLALLKALPLHVKETLAELAPVYLPEGFNFHEQKEALLRLSERLREELFEHEELKQTCANVASKLQSTAFSIGITGVMNAGKSTFLNALLRQEVLGTSTVPETANLAIIRHATTPSATVHFWNQEEWASIEQSALSSEAMSRFVQETKERFGQEWGAYVSPAGVSKTIPLEALGTYTSAKLSQGKCNLVKCVELYTDVALAREGVSIVDTPGLDDPVVQREEITKQYLVQCDVMIHLMNASQSATKKDVDFIIDALAYQRISRLVILITRVDMLTPAELEEVMAYTKRSIVAQLQALGKAHLVEPILEKIAIFPVAGALALWHRTGRAQEALAKGYDEEKTGILAIEAYLEEVLFGKDNERAALAIGANAKALRLASQTQRDHYQAQLAHLGVSAEELMSRREALRAQDVKGGLLRLLEELESLKAELLRYLVTMKQFAATRFVSLGAELLRRLSSDISYSLKKEGALPKPERLETMVHTAMKDGTMDTLREYRFALYRHIQAQSEPLGLGYGNVCSLPEYAFDPKAYIDEAAKKGLLSADHSLLAQRVCTLVAGASKKQTAPLFEAMSKEINQAISALEAKSMPRFEEVGAEMVEAFYQEMLQPVLGKKSALEEEERAIEEALMLAAKEHGALQYRQAVLAQKANALGQAIEQLTHWGKRP